MNCNWKVREVSTFVVFKNVFSYWLIVGLDASGKDSTTCGLWNCLKRLFSFFAKKSDMIENLKWLYFDCSKRRFSMARCRIGPAESWDLTTCWFGFGGVASHNRVEWLGQRLSWSPISVLNGSAGVFQAQLRLSVMIFKNHITHLVVKCFLLTQ